MRIAGYTFDAELLCNDCVPGLAELIQDGTPDEATYDSGDLPKVVFDYMLGNNERCDGCGEEL